MIEDFVASWELFHNAYLAAWLVAVLLSLPGVLVVARDEIFVGAALSQASTLGIATALWIAGWAASDGSWLRTDVFPGLLAVAFSIAAALSMAAARPAARESHEAVAGWVFLLSASASVLLVSHSPHGIEEVHRLLFSTIVGATAGDVTVFAALTVLAVILVAVLHRRLLLFSTDPVTARALGLRTRAYAAGYAVALGVGVGWSLKVAGLLYVFGCLILPPLIARRLCREARTMLIAAPSIALAAAVAGSVLAHHHDFPPAQMIVALLGTLLGVVWAAQAGGPRLPRRGVGTRS